MSEKTEESRAPSISVDSALDAVEDWYHVPVVAAVLAFMFWVRTQAVGNFTQNGQVYFSGNDAYYHLRQVTYTVGHWPQTMPFDVWTYFPNGTSVGQFGTLFDQLVATVALVVGLGSPDQHTIAMTLLYAPAVFGALLAIPTYFVGKRLGGRLGGVFAAVVLAFMPGYFLQRSVVGAADHNGAEPVFQALGVLGMMVALTVAEREKPVYEQFIDRDIAGLRRVVGWSVLAGIASAAYLWMWPPGVLLLGIFGVFFLVKLTSDYLHGTSPDHVAIVGAVSMATSGILLLLPLGNLEFSSTTYSLLQPLFAFATAFGCIFLAWLARQWDARSVDRSAYPVAVFGLLLVGLGAVSVLLPDLLGMIQRNLLRFVGFSAGAQTRTIGEAQPFFTRTNQYGLSAAGVIFMEYGLAWFVALLGAFWILVESHLRSRNFRRIAGAAAAVALVIVVLAAPALPGFVADLFGVDRQIGALGLVTLSLGALAVTGEQKAEHLLVVVWGAFITSAAFTQVRFNYYLVVPVVVLNAYALRVVLSAVDLDKPASALEDVGWWQVGTVVMVMLVVLVPVAAPVVASASGQSGSPIKLTNDQGQQVPLYGVTTIGQSQGPGAVTKWDQALEWMQTHTPDEGNMGGAGNADALDYYGTYSQTDDFDYPAGSYGVMSWWDYGHWITVEGERIPHANPFQQGATNAANFLLADSEERASEVLAGIEEDDAKVNYVAVDWKMVLPPVPSAGAGDSKFTAPVTFYDGPRNLTFGDFFKYAYSANFEGGQLSQVSRFQAPVLKEQAYYESMMTRLYLYGGSARKAQPVVLDWKPNRYGVPIFDRNTTNVRQFDTMSEARAYVKNDSTSQIGGYYGMPQEDVAALEHYRMIGVSDESLAPYNYFREVSGSTYPTWVKLFERVEGAKVTGTGPANTEVRASVTLNISQMMTNGSAPQFTYTQYAETGPDGEFTMTLPYSTTGYENWGPENGHTNTSVRAAGQYEFTTGNVTADDGLTTIEYNATADVTEAAVIGESGDVVTVDLQRHVVDVPEGKNNTSTDALSSPGATFDLDAAGAQSAGDASSDGAGGDGAGSDGASGVSVTAGALPALAGAAALTRRRAP